MKKVIYLSVIFIAIMLMSVSCKSCCNNNPTTPTLEETYSDWVDLNWYSTDDATEITNPEIYPRLNISISENKITVRQRINAYNELIEIFEAASISDGNFSFENPMNGSINMTGMYTMDGSNMTLITKGLINDLHVYVLN